MTRQHFNALTGIRAIAASMVFLYHHRKFWHQDLPAWMIQYFNEFHTGVSLFFVLSGFLIAYTYEDAPVQNKRSYLSYLLIRLVRIFPLYLLLITARYVEQGFPDSKVTFLTYTLWHGFSDRYNLSGIPQAWSLTVELSFYTVAPLIYWLSKRSIVKTFGALLLLLLLTLAIGYGWHAYNGNRDLFFYNWLFVMNGTFSGRFPEFLAGILLAHYIKGQRVIMPFPKRYSTATGGIAALACIYVISLFEVDMFHHGTDNAGGLFFRNLVLPVCIAWFLYGLIAERTWVRWFLSTRVMVLLGNASFAFYLFHMNYVNNKIYQWHPFPDRNFIALWILSIIAYLFIEKPLYNLLRKLIKRALSPRPKEGSNPLAT